MTMANNCRACKYFLRAVESWEMPHIWWYECRARPGFSNLKSFPFHDTKCKAFTRVERKPTINEILADGIKP